MTKNIILERYWITLLFIGIFILYLSPFRFLGSQDTYATRMLPISILKDGDLNIEEFIPKGVAEERMYFFIKSEDEFISRYPILPAILSLPVYSVPILLGVPLTDLVIAFLARLSASIITVLSVIFLYLIIKKYTSFKWSILLTVAYALGTGTWSTASQDLWQHGNSQLFLVLAVYFLIRTTKNSWYLFLAGIACGLAIAARPLNIIVIIIVFIYILYFYRKNFLYALLGIFPPGLLLALYNTYYFGRPWNTGYGSWTVKGWTSPITEGFFGLLFSPSRGLFFFTPFLLFSIFGTILIWKKNTDLEKNIKILLRYLSLSVLFYLLVVSKWWAWEGAYSFGPRMTLDLIPILVLMLIPVVNSSYFKHNYFKIVFTILVLFSIFIQLIGVTVYNYEYQGIDNFDSFGEKKSVIWSFREGQLYYYFNSFFSSL